MAAKEFDLRHDRVSGWSAPPQRFFLDTGLFQDVYKSKGSWRENNVTRIPVIDEHNPAAGAMWIDAKLFSDGYLRGNVKACSGEIQSAAVDVSGELTGSYLAPLEADWCRMLQSALAVAVADCCIMRDTVRAVPTWPHGQHPSQCQAQRVGQ